MFWSFWY